MGALIKTVATKENLRITKDDLRKEIGLVKDNLAKFKYDVSKDISESKANTIKWMFFFWITQVAATFVIFYFFLKK